MNLQKLRLRTFVIIGLIVAILSGFIVQLFAQQIVRGAYYADIGQIITRTAPIPAARGIILDRNGIPLVFNETSTALVFEAPFFPSRYTEEEQAQRNEVLVALLALFAEHEAEWLDLLPLYLDEHGNPQFEEYREDDIARMKERDFLHLNEWASAQDVFYALLQPGRQPGRFDLQNFEPQLARNIASIQYNMWRMDYRIGIPYIFAHDVSPAIVSYVLENHQQFPGVRTQAVPARRHLSGTLAPHTLGRVAGINAADHARHRDSDHPYRLTDDYGAFGLERAAQPDLRGREGEMTITINRLTDQTTQEITTPPQPGNTVVTTIDSGLQAMIEEFFPANMHANPQRRHPGVPVGGAAVVLCVRTFEVLASVSYPSFDVTEYAVNFADLHSDPRTPLLNRALLGAYEPGSTIKAQMSLAALQEGIITPQWSIRCTGVYHFGGTTFRCPQVFLHRGNPVNVRRAMIDSCNFFYYHMGRQLRYAQINAYRMAQGLGVPTGVELPESLGVMDSPEFRASRGQTFYEGLNLLTAIGQGNLFTPIQLAVHTATIANFGERRSASFIHSVRRPGTNEIVRINEPEVLSRSGIERRHYEFMHGVMRDSANHPGTLVQRYFNDLPVQVAGKTGTSEVYRVINGRNTLTSNGLFISFAPYDNPEIAVIAIGEGGRGSAIVIPTIAAIYDYWFNQNHLNAPTRENVLL
ncbi:MAG: penicillin-binding transpeptidase domain-containing protein [Oscillospiraceae bacterium]|nr:penicillin-binding transpeptidase domain-containing protein [Oscillospiraceae bacterium]